jgi:hypothetical protein
VDLRVQIIERSNQIAMAQQRGGTMRSDETCSPRDQNGFRHLRLRELLLYRGFNTSTAKRFKRLTRIFTFGENFQ